MGPGVSQESGETQDGLHVWEDHFLPEIVDPLTLEPVADGEEGELVFTSLTKQAMPVVRYRTRDLTRLLPGTAYPAFRRMQKVTGRTDDMMIVRGVNVFPTQVEEQILAVDGLAPHYVCVLTRPGNLDELTVRVESVLSGGRTTPRRRRSDRRWPSGSRTGSASPPAWRWSPRTPRAVDRQGAADRGPAPQVTSREQMRRQASSPQTRIRAIPPSG